MNTPITVRNNLLPPACIRKDKNKKTRNNQNIVVPIPFILPKMLYDDELVNEVVNNSFNISNNNKK
jgi:hypothetical protein